MEIIFILPFLTAATFHVVNRAQLTEAVWTWYSRWPRIDRFLSCAACTGFWYGAAWMTLGHELGWTFLGATNWWVIGLAAVCSVIWTPIFVKLQEDALRAISGYETPEERDDYGGVRDSSDDGGPSWDGGR